ARAAPPTAGADRPGARLAGDARDHHGPTARRRDAAGSDVALAQAPTPGHAHTARRTCGGCRPRRRRPPLPDGLPIARSPADGVARLSVRPRRSPRDARIARRGLQRLGCDPHTDAPGRKRSPVDRGGAARSRALSLRVLRGRRALAGRPLGARGPRRGLRRTQLGADRGGRGLMTSDLTRTALPLLAAILLAGAAASQQTDPRLERLDAGTRPIVAALVDSAHRALLPTEPLVQRALKGATKRASGGLIVAAVRRLAVDLGRARDALGSTASPAELSAGAAALHAGASQTILAERGPASSAPAAPNPVRPAAAARHLWTASLAAATSLLAVRAPVAQTTGTVDLGVSTVRYDGFLRSGAVSLTPTLTWERPGTAVTGRGTYLRFESGRRSLQGLIAASLFPPPSLRPVRWRGELFLSAGGSSYADFASFWHATGEARVHLVMANRGAWIAGTGGRTSYGSAPRPVAV